MDSKCANAFCVLTNKRTPQSRARNLPGPESEIFVFHLGGAMARVASAATAFPQRDAHFGMNVRARWREASGDSAHIAWAKKVFDDSAPHSTGTAYVNFMPEDESDRVEAVYGANYRRLADAKRRYDPTNFFRLNQNVRPATRDLRAERATI
jgi:Berberine and berberine like